VTITSPQNNSSVSEVVSITCMSSYNEGVEKVEDLVWTEIDTKEHYRRAFDYVYPKLLKIENE